MMMMMMMLYLLNALIVEHSIAAAAGELHGRNAASCPNLTAEEGTAFDTWSLSVKTSVFTMR